jgi:VCBS repeat-containing protein
VDAMTLKVTNEYGLSTTNTLTFEIEAVNDAPIANEDSATTEENTTLVLKADDILANDTDVDKNDTKSLVAITAPADKGSVVFDAATGNITFKPNSDFDHLAQGESEEVLLTYTMEDKAGAQSSSVVKLTVTGTNDAPVIEDITPIAAHEDDAVVTGNIVASDVDDNATALYSTTAAVAGFTLNKDGSYSFNPADEAYQSLAKDEIQTITIPVTVTDDQGATDSKDLVIQITGTNDIPTVTTDTQSLLLQNIRNIDGKVEADDIDGDKLTYSVATQAAHGVVTIDTDGKWHYKAEGSFNGEDNAVVLVDDGNGGNVTQTLNFTVDGYIYEGKDLVINEASGKDTLSMTNINKEQLSFSRNEDDLQIAVNDGGTITLKNYFNNIDAGVETLHTAQGDINLSRDVINDVQSHWWYGSFRAKDTQDHLISGTSFNDRLQGNNGNDIILGANRYDWLQGEAGDDLLVGGNSNDRLYGDEGDDNLYGDAGNDYLDGGKGNDALIGGSGKDRLYGDIGDDYLAGGSGNDRLNGDKGDDTLIGGTGNDYLEGYYGSDTYIFNKGDGHDTIDEWSQKESSNSDTIKFGAGITKENLTVLRDRYDAIFQIDADNSIRVKDWFDDDNRSVVENIEFADNTLLTAADVNTLAVVKGTERNNRLYGMDKLNDNLFGLDGNDRLYGYEGDDFLSGGSGKDRLYGDQGNDTLIGGAGDDYLEGYYGNDTYIFNKGDGSDTISEWTKQGSNDNDTIKFGDGITKDDISFTLDHGDMLVQYATDDLIKIKDADDTRGQVEKMELSNGMYVTNDDMDLIIQQINAYGAEKGMDNISNNDIQNNKDLMNIVSSAWHE